MNARIFMKILSIGLFLSACSCQDGNLSNSKQGPTEKSAETEIVENRLHRLQKQRNLQNESTVFRGIPFGAHLSRVMKKCKMEFVRTGYELNYAEGSRTQITQLDRELLVDGDVVPISFPEQHRCMTCLSQNGKHAKMYRVADDKLSIGSIPVQSIFYQFYEEKFCGVSIRFDGKHWFDMERLFFSKYGEKEDGLDSRLDWHIWEGESTYIKLWTVPRNETEKSGCIEYCYLPLRQQDQEKYAREVLRWTEHRAQQKDRGKVQPWE